MSKRQKTKPVLVKPNQEVMILPNQHLQQQKLEKINRLLLLAVFALMLVVFVMSSFLLPSEKMVEDLKEKQLVESVSYENSLRNPVISDEIDTLKRQVVGLVSGSIEGKLNSLEKSIKLGSFISSLETVRSLRQDVKMLHTYSDPLELKQQQDAQINQILAKEVSQLKNLIYLTFGSCALMFAALAGIWMKGRKQLLAQQPHYLEKKN